MCRFPSALRQQAPINLPTDSAFLSPSDRSGSSLHHAWPTGTRAYTSSPRTKSYVESPKLPSPRMGRGFSHYEVLGIPRTATREEIRMAFVKLAKRSHPDVVSPEELPASSDRFQRILRAYTELCDTAKRRDYDWHNRGEMRASVSSAYAHTDFQDGRRQFWKDWEARRQRLSEDEIRRSERAQEAQCAEYERRVGDRFRPRRRKEREYIDDSEGHAVSRKPYRGHIVMPAGATTPSVFAMARCYLNGRALSGVLNQLWRYSFVHYFR